METGRNNNTNVSSITDIYFETDVLYAEVKCGVCGHVFKVAHGSLGGVGYIKERCPKCNVEVLVDPETYDKALERSISYDSFEEAARVIEKATYITEHWYRHPLVARVLTYKNVNLGEGMEREVMSMILESLYLEGKSKA